MESIPVSAIEFVPSSGTTLWIQGKHGGTVLRIKCTGKIHVHEACASPYPHGDLLVQGDIELCLPANFLKA